MPLSTGDRVPDFSAEATDGPFTLSEKLGAPLVLYFYPKDQTPGCTTEACDFRDLRGELEALGARVYGISQDSLKSHGNFIAKQGLNFPLISDPEHTVHGVFDTWVEKKNYGRVYMGTERSSFLIDGEGVLRQAWRKVRVKGHADAVLEAVKALGAA